MLLRSVANAASMLASLATSISNTAFEPNSCGHRLDAILEPLLIAEGQLGAFAPHRRGDAVGDGALRRETDDQRALACKKSHDRLLEAIVTGAECDCNGNRRRSPAQGRCHCAARLFPEIRRVMVQSQASREPASDGDLRRSKAWGQIDCMDDWIPGLRGDDELRDAPCGVTTAIVRFPRGAIARTSPGAGRA